MEQTTISQLRVGTVFQFACGCEWKVVSPRCVERVRWACGGCSQYGARYGISDIEPVWVDSFVMALEELRDGTS